MVVRSHHVMAGGIALHAAATLLLDESPTSTTWASAVTVDSDVVGDPRAIVTHVRAAATELVTLVRCTGPHPMLRPLPRRGTVRR